MFSHLKYKISACFIFLFIAPLFTQVAVGEWQSLTSLLTPLSIHNLDNEVIYAATEGGILKYEIDDAQYSFITDVDGLEYLDFAAMSRDESGNFWLGGNNPKGTLQIYDPESGLIAHIEHLDLDQITKFDIDEQFAFAIYEQGTEIGIIKFIINENGIPEFQDRFSNFPHQIGNILDIDHDADSLLFATSSHIYIASLNDILNFSSSWHISFESPDEKIQQIIRSEQTFAVLKDKIFIRTQQNGWEQFSTMPNSIVIDAQLFDNFNRIGILTTTNYLEYDLNGVLQSDFSMPVTTEFTCMSRYSNYISLGLRNQGILNLNLTDLNYDIYVPNTLMSNTFHSLYFTETGQLIGHKSDPGSGDDRLGGLFTFKDGIFSHFISTFQQETFLLNDFSENTFTGIGLDWTIGGRGSGGVITSASGNILAGNRGTMPIQEDGKGGVIEIDLETFEFSIYDTTDGILDGQYGIIDGNSASRYIVIHQLHRDPQDNIWVVNPYSEKYNHLAAIQLSDGETWTHITAPDDSSYLPQEVAFDGKGRAWFGLRKYLTQTDGGIKVVNYGNIEDGSDDIWYFGDEIIYAATPPGINVWSVTFDQQGLLWILTNGGVQGYFTNLTSNGFYLSPIYPTDFLSYMPFAEGDKIRVDAQNNKWVITAHSGVRIIQENTNYWPTEEGFTENNSGLLSDIVYDVAFDDENGIAYFATDKGISLVGMPYQKTPDDQMRSLSISPNPFIIPETERVTIENFYPGSEVKVLTLNGNIIIELRTEDSGLFTTRATWDGRDKSGGLVGSGIYLISSQHPDEGGLVTKIAVIRQ